jgi:hypothetical protein
MSIAQPSLFAAPPAGLPEGFAYQPDFISRDEEAELARRLAPLPFAPFQFHGYEGNRRVVSFGWRYDFNQGGLKRAEPFPDWLRPLAARAAARQPLTAVTQARAAGARRARTSGR